MKQSRLMSFMETMLSTAIGFAVALATQLFVFPLFGFNPPLHENLMITAIFTVVSIIRQFVMRRIFEALHIRRPLSPFMLAAIAERYAHADREGYTVEHDADHCRGELSRAGAAYLLHAGTCSPNTPHEWPWADGWNPKDYRRDLVRGVALGIAEGEKFDADRKRGRGR